MARSRDYISGFSPLLLPLLAIIFFIFLCAIVSAYVPQATMEGNVVGRNYRAAEWKRDKDGDSTYTPEKYTLVVEELPCRAVHHIEVPRATYFEDQKEYVWHGFSMCRLRDKLKGD
jgi:hypothetical protein